MTSLASPNLVAQGNLDTSEVFKSREMKYPFNNLMRSAVKCWETNRLQMIDT